MEDNKYYDLNGMATRFIAWQKHLCIVLSVNGHHLSMKKIHMKIIASDSKLNKQIVGNEEGLVKTVAPFNLHNHNKFKIRHYYYHRLQNGCLDRQHQRNRTWT